MMELQLCWSQTQNQDKNKLENNTFFPEIILTHDNLQALVWAVSRKHREANYVSYKTA